MENLRGLLREKGFYFKKSFGQNFISDENLLESIVQLGGITEKDDVLEIGVGAGTLTKVLSKKAKFVLGYEIDRTLQSVIENTLENSKNVKIIYKDFMKESLADIEKAVKDYVVVANLPYYITTPVICRFLEEAKSVKALVIMVQEEVAERLTAKEGTKDYGAITAAVNFSGSAKIIKRVPRQAFIPMPNVDSAVVKIDIFDKYPDVERESYRKVVRSAFSSRRKTLVNNLMNYFNIEREKAESVLKNCGIDITVRGERLSANDFVKITKELL